MPMRLAAINCIWWTNCWQVLHFNPKKQGQSNVMNNTLKSSPSSGYKFTFDTTTWSVKYTWGIVWGHDWCLEHIETPQRHMSTLNEICNISCSVKSLVIRTVVLWLLHNVTCFHIICKKSLTVSSTTSACIYWASYIHSDTPVHYLLSRPTSAIWSILVIISGCQVDWPNEW